MLLSSVVLRYSAFSKKLSSSFLLVFLSLFSFAQDLATKTPFTGSSLPNLPDNGISICCGVHSSGSMGNLPVAFTGNRLHEYSYDTLSPEQKKKRIWIVAGSNVLGYGSVMIGLWSAWYKDFPHTSFHTFNDNKEWLQVDKVGHMFSAYTESRGSMELWRWTGIDRKKRIWIGGMSGAFYQTVIEVLDGFSAAWGWSWGDFGANILGSGAMVAQELAWNDQRIKIKFSVHRNNYKDLQLEQRSNELFGKAIAERFLKDYNAQTYWASMNLKPFFPGSNLPSWLSVSVGYGAEGMFGAERNVGKDANGNTTFNRQDIKRYRQWFLAPDIDLSKIKTHKKGVKFILDFLSALKFPTPSLELSNGKFKLHAKQF